MVCIMARDKGEYSEVEWVSGLNYLVLGISTCFQFVHIGGTGGCLV